MRRSAPPRFNHLRMNGCLHNVCLVSALSNCSNIRIQIRIAVCAKMFNWMDVMAACGTISICSLPPNHYLKKTIQNALNRIRNGGGDDGQLLPGQISIVFGNQEKCIYDLFLLDNIRTDRSDISQLASGGRVEFPHLSIQAGKIIQDYLYEQLLFTNDDCFRIGQYLEHVIELAHFLALIPNDPVFSSITARAVWMLMEQNGNCNEGLFHYLAKTDHQLSPLLTLAAQLWLTDCKELLPFCQLKSGCSVCSTYDQLGMDGVKCLISNPRSLKTLTLTTTTTNWTDGR